MRQTKGEKMESALEIAAEGWPDGGRIVHARLDSSAGISRKQSTVLNSAHNRKVVRRAKLTPREREVALLLAKRRTSKEIAEALGVTFATARRHTERVLEKLGLNSRRTVEKYFDDP